jgi:hypothetical protein
VCAAIGLAAIPITFLLVRRDELAPTAQPALAAD